MLPNDGRTYIFSSTAGIFLARIQHLHLSLGHFCILSRDFCGSISNSAVATVHSLGDSWRVSKSISKSLQHIGYGHQEPRRTISSFVCFVLLLLALVVLRVVFSAPVAEIACSRGTEVRRGRRGSRTDSSGARIASDNEFYLAGHCLGVGG